MCLQAIRELGIDEFLEREGWSEVRINTALAHLIIRTVYAPSELASMDYMRERSTLVALLAKNSAVCELLTGPSTTGRTTAPMPIGTLHETL